MFDLELVNKISTVEKETGQSLPRLLGQVPFGNVLTAFNTIPVSGLIEMVQAVPFTKLTHGLSIITPNEIIQIPFDKLKAVLFHGNMNTVQKLQETFHEKDIITSINSMELSQLTSLLEEDNYEVMKNVIEDYAKIITI